ncbi:MAG: alpha/beta hydrolase [Nakamurella sp.]
MPVDEFLTAAAPRITLSTRLLALAAQQLWLRLARTATEPSPSRPVDPPAEIVVRTRYGNVRCLVFRPHPDAPLAGTATSRPPLHIEIHGGGMILRNVHEDNHICRYLASEVGCVVVSVDYHAAPQVFFPVAEHECFDVLAWAVANAEQWGWDPERISVGGGSAGAKLAVNVAQQAAHAGIGLRAATLAYPLMDLTDIPRTSPKARPALSPKLLALVRSAYYVDVSIRRDALASPVFDEHLAQAMPPTLIQAGTQDSLLADAHDLARQLRSGGVDVQLTDYDSDHAFTVDPKSPHLRSSVQEIAAFLRARLG